jgi:metacaspase-1
MQMPEAYASVGAMTHSFVKAVECEPPGVTYGRLLTAMKAIMLNSGGNCNMQGPIGAPIRKIANFSGVQVRLETCCMPFCVDKSLPS